MTNTRLRAAIVAACAVMTVITGWGAVNSHVRENGWTFIIVGCVVAWSFVVAGLVAWNRRPDNRTGPLMTLVGFAWLCAGLTESPNDLSFTAGMILGSLWAPLLLHLLLAYPSGRLTGRARWVVAAGYIDTVGVSLLAAPFSQPRLDGDADKRSASNILLVDHQHAVATTLDTISLAIGLVLIAITIVITAKRWRSASPASRRVLLPVYGTGVIVVAGIGGLALANTGSDIAFYLFSLLFVTLPLGFLAGLLNTRLAQGGAVSELVVSLERSADPERTRASLRRALKDPHLELVFRLSDGRWVDVDGEPVERPTERGHQAVTEVVRGGQVVAALIHDPMVREDGALLDSVCTTAALALENQRLQADLRAQLRAVSRLADEQASLRRVATLVASTSDPQAVFDAVTEEVARLLESPTANLVHYESEATIEVVSGWSEPGVGSVPSGTKLEIDSHTVTQLIRETGRPARIDDYGPIPGELARRLRALGFKAAVAAPVYVGGDLWGAITISSTGGPFPPGAETRIADFTELVGLALSSAEARRALAASRARVVAAGDAERRRVERNLHDGAQQQLVSMRLGLRMARRQLESDPPAADATLERAELELDGALEELRKLARGLHPAVLSDRGLSPALHALADRSGVPVSVVGVPDDRLPESVEVAVYYVVSESLANVAKHAQASAAEVSLTQSDGTVTVVVADDGVGGAAADVGGGLRGLADRVEALSGRLRVESARGAGTRVIAEIPCTARADNRT